MVHKFQFLVNSLRQKGKKKRKLYCAANLASSEVIPWPVIMSSSNACNLSWVALPKSLGGCTIVSGSLPRARSLRTKSHSRSKALGTSCPFPMNRKEPPVLKAHTLEATTCRKHSTGHRLRQRGSHSILASHYLLPLSLLSLGC